MTNMKRLLFGLFSALSIFGSFAMGDDTHQITFDQFIHQYTDGGVLYHGTAISKYKGILRDGIKRMPLGSFGFYTTPEMEYASAHAFGYNSADGVILPMQVRPEIHDLKILVKPPESDLSGETAAAEGYDVLVAPLPEGAPKFHTNGTKVTLLSTAKFLVPPPIKTFQLARANVVKKINDGSVHWIELVALSRLYDLIPETEKPMLPSELISKIEAAKIQSRRPTRHSIATCGGLLDEP